jgi:hypothetical protein
MSNRKLTASVAALGAIALVVAGNVATARPAAARNTTFTSAHASMRPPVAAFRHHHGRRDGVFWPGGYYDPSYSEPLVDAAAPPTSGDVHYTYTYDVPWDWVHRLPPQVAPSDHPYVPSCPTETVTVTGRNGQEQTVNVTRCY